MLTIIHGDDVSKSRKYFIELKSKSPDAQIIEGKDIDLTYATQILEGGNLFLDEKSLFIDNFLSKKNNISGFESILKYLKNQTNNKIVIWENKEIERNNLKSLKGAEIKLFKFPQSIFTFLESIKPDNGRYLLQLFHHSLQYSDAEAIFYLIIRQMRLLLAVQTKQNSSNIQGSENEIAQTISEVIRLAPWQKTKIQKQATLFTIDELIYNYEKLFEIEHNYKTGNLSLDLTSSIDIFLLEI